MAQRNPLNPRYQGEGPGGQTKKSASSAKPATEAASSVYKKSKPATSSEKRAAAKAREKEIQTKNAEKSRKAAEKARLKAAAEAEGGEAAAPVVTKKAASSTGSPKNFIQKIFSPAPNMPDSPEYKKWRMRYWILMIAGIVSVALSWTFQMFFSDITLLWTVFMVLAYGFIALAFFVDFKKVRPLITAHQRTGTVAKSPKQMKHERESAERAAQLEAARKAAREATHKPLLRRKKKDSDEKQDTDV